MFSYGKTCPDLVLCSLEVDILLWVVNGIFPWDLLMILSNVEIQRTGSSTCLAFNQVGNYKERLYFLLAGTETCQVCVVPLHNSLSWLKLLGKWLTEAHPKARRFYILPLIPPSSRGAFASVADATQSCSPEVFQEASLFLEMEYLNVFVLCCLCFQR